MKLQTKVNFPDYPFSIGYNDSVFLTGSCFTENIGSSLAQYKFNTLINPFGILYNPISVCNGLQKVISIKKYTKGDLFYFNDLYQSYDHHGSFSDRDAEGALNKMNASVERAHHFLKKAGTLILTFGTAFVYKHKEENRVVANCHKVPDREFSRILLQPEHIEEPLNEFIEELLKFNKKINILFTVSPVRHLRDGLIANQRSKASLLTAVHNLVDKHKSAYYFPSYELMMDEWRDYRFYDEDLVHPSSIAVKMIWESFVDQIIDKEDKTEIEAVKSILAGVKHRPFNPESESFKKFAREQLRNIDKLKSKLPDLDFSSEEDHFKRFT